MSITEQLQQAYQLIRQEQRTEAMQILVQIVREDPNNGDAWWLLANAVTNPDQQRRAVEQVLRLRPDDDKAQRLMAKIAGGAPPARSFYEEPTMLSSAPPTDPFASDPFAQPAPAARSVPPAQRRTEPDPFASTNAFDGTPNRAAAPERKRKRGDDPFDDPFSDPPTNAYPPDRSRRVSEVGVPRRRRSGCGTCFIIFSVITLVLCGVCTLATFALPAVIRPIFNQIADAVGTQSPSSGIQFRSALDAIYAGDAEAAATALSNLTTGLGTEVALTIEANPVLRDARSTLEAGGQIAPSLRQTLEAASAGIASINFSLGSTDAEDKGAIEIGQTVRDTLPSGSGGYRYRVSGLRANETLVLTATTTGDATLNIVIEIYPSGSSTLIDSVDEEMRGDAETLFWTPPQDGSYDVVVRGFGGSGGAFTLEIARQ